MIVSRPPADALPSQTFQGSVWLHETGPLRAPMISQRHPRIGKWMVFLSSAHADELWPRIKTDLKSGALGLVSFSAKISLPKVKSPNSHVLIIYTSDYDES